MSMVGRGSPSTTSPSGLFGPFMRSANVSRHPFFYVVTRMRDRIAFKVIERTGPMFGLAVLVEEASLREYALALLQYFSTPRQRRTSWLCTRRRRSSSRGRRSLSGTACALAAGATSRCRLSRIRPYPHSLARVCAPTHTRARPALVPALAELLARVHTVPGVQLMSCHACGWFIKGNTTQTVPGTAQEPARDARERCSDVGAVFCVFSLEFTRQAERIVRRCSRRTLEHPKRGAPTAAVPHTALSDGMFCLEAGGGVQLACGRCHRPAEPSRLRSAARVGWRRRAPCRPRTSYVLALGAKQPAPNTQCRVNCARRLICPSGRCASRRRPTEVSGRENPVLTRGVCLLTQASLGPDLV